MIHEEYVSFETAKLLKEAGWDIPTRGIYRTNRNGDYRFVEYDRKSSLSNCTRCLTDGFAYEYLAPTQALAARWLREVHDIHIDIGMCGDYSSDADGKIVEEWDFWTFSLYYITNFTNHICNCVGEYDTYEQAMDAGLQRALEMIKERKDEPR